MDRNPLEEQVLRCVHCHCPELTLDEAHVTHDKVCRIPDDEVDRPAGHVASAIGQIIPAALTSHCQPARFRILGWTKCPPDLAIPVERAVAVSSPEDVVAPEVPGNALVLISER